MRVAVSKYFITITMIICVGKLILSSMPSFVCDGNDITLTCNSSNGRMRWTVMFPESIQPYPITRQISSTKVAATEEAFRITVNQTVSVFHIQRCSDYNTTPLVTSLLIENVSAGINETNISCSSVPSSDSENKQFMILVIDDNQRHDANPINVNKTLEFYGIDNFRVTLEWVEEEGLVYNISISPPAIATALLGNTSVELTLLYNTLYSVTIAAISQCGLTTTLSQLSQTKCAYPSVLNGSNIQVVDYVAPALEGSQESFICSPGMVLTGRNVSVCAGNGEWEPDPSQARCKANCGPQMNNTYINFQYNSTLEGSVLTFLCSRSDSHSQTFVAVCQKSGNWDPDPISRCTAQNSGRGSNNIMVIIAAVITSTLLICIFFIIGLVCGKLLPKFPKRKLNHEQKNDTDHEVETSQEKDLEMMENVAYGPLPLRV